MVVFGGVVRRTGRGKRDGPDDLGAGDVGDCEEDVLEGVFGLAPGAGFEWCGKRSVWVWIDR